MSRTTRLGIAIGFVAAVGIAGAAFGNAGGSGARRDRPIGAGPGAGFGHGLLSKVVTGETMFSTDDGFVTRLIDAGPVTSVDGDTVTIERADDERVSATASDDTRVTRDGARAELSDVEVGDHVFIVRVDRGDGPVVEAIHAVSPERMAERRARRAGVSRST